MKLHLGCSDSLLPGFLNVDKDIRLPVADRSYRAVDLRKHWPWGDSEVDYIYSKDCFEHIDTPEFPGWEGMIWTFNESHRVLKPGGILELVVPCLPGIAPFVDPTHKVIYTQDTRYYFDERWNNPLGERGRLGPGMGIKALFKTLANSKSGVDWEPVAYAADAPERRKLFLLLEAVK